MSAKRTTLAFALSPLFPSLYFLILPYFSNTAYEGRYDVPLILLFSVPVSYGSCLLFGMPLFFFLKKKKLLNFINAIISGAVVGVVVFYIFGFGVTALLGYSKNAIPSLSELFWGAALGVMVALPFSLLAGLPFFRAKNNE